MRVSMQGLERYQYPMGAAAFMVGACPTEGGQPFTLVDWEREVTRAVYESEQRPRVALIGLPRGYGKSEYLARLGWYELIARGEGTEIFVCAGDRDQARIIHQRMVRIRRSSRLLASCSKEYRDAIEVPSTGALLRVISADAPTAFGLQPHLVLFDELHVQPNRELWDAMYSSLIKRPDALLIAATTAGHDFQSVCREVYERAIGGTEPRWYCLWLEGDQMRPPWIRQEDIDEARRTLPLPVFQRLHENRWVAASGSVWTREQVMACRDATLEPQVVGRRSQSYYLGVDLGLVSDRTAAITLHKDHDTGRVIVDAIQVWEGSQSAPVQIAEVESYIAWALKAFPTLTVVVDPWQLQSTIQRLRMYRVTAVHFGNEYIARLSTNLHHLVAGGLLRFFPYPLLESELTEVVARQTPFGWRLDHASNRHDDIVIALGMAALEAAAAPRPGRINTTEDMTRAYGPHWRDVLGF